MKKCKIYSLLTQNEKGEVKGATSPILFAKEMMKDLGWHHNRIARVQFNDNEIHNWYENVSENGKTKRCLTACDTLLVGSQGAKGMRFVCMFIDRGSNGIPTGMWQQGEKTVTLAPIYEESVFEKKLTAKEIYDIIVFAINNNKFAIKQPPVKKIAVIRRPPIIKAVPALRDYKLSKRVNNEFKNRIS